MSEGIALQSEMLDTILLSCKQPIKDDEAIIALKNAGFQLSGNVQLVEKALNAAKKAIAGFLTVFILTYATQSEASSLEKITACGKSAYVSRTYAAQFQGFITEICESGYKIKFIGGWRKHGSCKGCNMHPRGMAIDVNQTARNRVTNRLPKNITAMAARHGLTHGSTWRRPDTGHFEVAKRKTHQTYARAE